MASGHRNHATATQYTTIQKKHTPRKLSNVQNTQKNTTKHIDHFASLALHFILVCNFVALFVVVVVVFNMHVNQPFFSCSDSKCQCDRDRIYKFFDINPAQKPSSAFFSTENLYAVGQFFFRCCFFAFLLSFCVLFIPCAYVNACKFRGCDLLFFFFIFEPLNCMHGWHLLVLYSQATER